MCSSDLFGGLGGTGVVPQLLRVLVASAVLAAGCWATGRAVAPFVGASDTLLRQAVGALAPISVGAALYFLTARLLRLDEVTDLVSFVRRRRGTRS